MTALGAILFYLMKYQWDLRHILTSRDNYGFFFRIGVKLLYKSLGMSFGFIVVVARWYLHQRPMIIYWLGYHIRVIRHASSWGGFHPLILGYPPNVKKDKRKETVFLQLNSVTKHSSSNLVVHILSNKTESRLTLSCYSWWKKKCWPVVQQDFLLNFCKLLELNSLSLYFRCPPLNQGIFHAFSRINWFYGIFSYCDDVKKTDSHNHYNPQNTLPLPSFETSQYWWSYGSITTLKWNPFWRPLIGLKAGKRRSSTHSKKFKLSKLSLSLCNVRPVSSRDLFFPVDILNK